MHSGNIGTFRQCGADLGHAILARIQDDDLGIGIHPIKQGVIIEDIRIDKNDFPGGGLGWGKIAKKSFRREGGVFPIRVAGVGLGKGIDFGSRIQPRQEPCRIKHDTWFKGQHQGFGGWKRLSLNGINRFGRGFVPSDPLGDLFCFHRIASALLCRIVATTHQEMLPANQTHPRLLGYHPIVM